MAAQNVPEGSSFESITLVNGGHKTMTNVAHFVERVERLMLEWAPTVNQAQEWDVIVQTAQGPKIYRQQVFFDKN